MALKKLETERPYDPAITLLGMYPKELKQGLKDFCTLFSTATFSYYNSLRSQMFISK